jgi:hypothetical protein
MTRTKLKLMIDPKQYNSKPTDPNIITKNIIYHPKEIDVESLANEIVNGKTFMCGYIEKDSLGRIKRNESYWRSQQVIALDFDNEIETENELGKKIKIKHVSATLDDALKNEFIKKYAAFAYKTFSYTDDHPKFRIVFVLEKPFYDLKKCRKVIELLLEKFPVADTQCKDGVRLFYGGKELHVINYNNRLPNDPTLWEDIKGIESIYPTKGCSSQSLNNTCKNKKSKLINTFNSKNTTLTISNNSKLATNIELIKRKDIPVLHKKIQPKPIILHNNHQVYDYLKKQDLKVFLGVNSNTLYDVFHDEDRPSASIYQSDNKNGHWLYKCHSTSSPFVGTILQITEKLLNCSMVEAKEFLMKVYQIEIQENETQKRLKEEIDAYKYILQSEELPELYPNFHKLFNKYGFIEDLYILLDLVKENLPANSDDPRLLFYHSIYTLAERFGRSPSNTGIRMNFFTFFRLICKLDEDEIPEYILKAQKEYQKNKKHRYRSNTYEMKIYSYDFFAELDRKCEEWMAKGLTTKSMNYEGILRNFGREEADRVFPQDKNKEISQLHDDIVFKIEKTALKLINEKGWTTEKEILENVNLYFKGQKKLKESLMKRCIGDMLEKYDLERISCNKQIKNEMGITEDQLPLSSFPKLIRRKNT